MHNLTKTLAVVSLLVPASGYSLGIGDLKLRSALNQNLDAEISLIVSAGENASDIKVNLAAPDKFDEAGVPWVSFLSKIKFSTVVGANGSVIIKLNSREAVKEPFLDLLLEVSWPKGRLYREFTVLLDPPAVYKQATLPVLTSSESYGLEQVAIPERQSKQRAQVNPESTLSGASEYGPTRRNDTLWKVAERASRQAGVSAEQMMIAMFEENPHAFFKENVHALSAGKTMKIPEREIILKLSRKQALAEYHRQTIAWKNRLAPASSEAVIAKKDIQDNQLTLVAPTEADIAENAIVAPENEQVTAKKIDDATASKTIDKEAVSTVSPVSDALQGKVAELEKQLAMMQQILVLKDQQLAGLQNQFQAKPAIQPEVVQATASGQTGVANPIAQQKPIQPDVRPPVQPAPEAVPPLNTYYLWVSSVGGGALSLLGWLWWRKRKYDEHTNSISPFVSSGKGITPESKSFFSTPIEKDGTNNADADGKNPLLSAVTFGDFDTFDIDQGEIDPVSEADVYLAYGRYQQAEELLLDVIKDQPSRDECKLKLLEIYYSNNNKPAFETYANELAQAGKKDDVGFWAKVTEMGSEICQDSTLFSSGASVFPPIESIIFEKKTVNLFKSDNIEKNEVADIKESNFGSSSSGKLFKNEEAVKELPQTTDNLLGFDLNFFEDEVIDEQQNNESIDFDLSTIATKTEDSSETLIKVVPKAQEFEIDNELESFDFDFGFGENESEIKEIDTNAVKETVDNYQLSDALPDLNDSFTTDSLNKNAYIDSPISGLNGNDFDQDVEFEVFDLTDMDELETKLDLAKAYIDMSDASAAKDMACQVLEKGTEEQKKIARALLNDLK